MAKSRFDTVDTFITHKGTTIKLAVGDKIYDALVETSDSSENQTVGFIPVGFSNRPDLISQVFYGTPANWWIIMLNNNIEDPFEKLKAGDAIKVPK